MATIVTRAGKGTTLTWAEMDANLTNLNSGIIQTLNSYGAVGDGITDDTAAIQLAIDSTDIVLTGLGKTYKCNTKLILSSNITLRDMTLDFSSLTALDGSHRTCVKAEGTVGTSVALAANAVEGAYSITLAASGGLSFAAGDYVQLTSEDAYNYAAATVKRGEIKQIQSIVGDVITFREALYEGYTTANTATLRKLNLLSNIILDGVNLIGTNIEGHLNIGVKSNYVNNLQIRNCSFLNFDLYATPLYNTINFIIDNCDYDGVRYAASGTAFYGVVLFNCTQWGQVTNNRGQELRHLVTTSSSGVYYGQPYFITVDSNNMRNAMAGDGFASWAYENHGFGRWIIWSNNIADSCYCGINIEKGDNIVIGNIFKNIRLLGINFDADGRDIKNVVIANNHISKVTNDSTTGAIVGIAFQTQASMVRENILITGNIIEGFSFTGRSDFGIRIYAGSGAGKNCVISNNLISNNGAYESTDYGIYIDQGGWVIRGNTFRDYERAVSILVGSDNTTFCGNDISVTTIASTQPAVTVAANTCVLKENVFRTLYRAFNISAGATGNHVYNNTEISSSLPSVDGGTGTIKVQPAF